jgi:mannitol/fructose-specific phosphotransferase system IIA component (Ntr-type)
MNMSSDAASIPLSDMISLGTVRAQARVGAWEEAVDCVGALLVDGGKVEPSYIPAMKRVLKEMGPYAVIAPGIVLLHARPEDGVREACLGLVTLATPVRFGHSENDPVDLVFALGAVDKQSHIASLKELAEMLGNPEVLKKLRTAETDRQLAAVFGSDHPVS